MLSCICRSAHQRAIVAEEEHMDRDCLEKEEGKEASGCQRKSSFLLGALLFFPPSKRQSKQNQREAKRLLWDLQGRSDFQDGSTRCEMLDQIIFDLSTFYCDADNGRLNAINKSRCKSFKHIYIARITAISYGNHKHQTQEGDLCKVCLWTRIQRSTSWHILHILQGFCRPPWLAFGLLCVGREENGPHTF